MLFTKEVFLEREASIIVSFSAVFSKVENRQKAEKCKE